MVATHILPSVVWAAAQLGKVKTAPVALAQSVPQTVASASVRLKIDAETAQQKKKWQRQRVVTAQRRFSHIPDSSITA